MTRRYAWFLGALLSIPVGAQAQATEPPGEGGEVPTPPVAGTEAPARADGEGSGPEATSEDLEDVRIPDPTGELSTPDGYGGRASRRTRRREGRVSVLSFGDGPLTLHVRTSEARELRPVCTAPCTAQLLEGTYFFGVGPRGHGPRQADGQPIHLTGPDQVILMHYDNRSGLRSVGWAFFTAAAMSLALSALPLLSNPSNVFPILLIGLPLAAGFSIPFFSMAFLMDAARVEVTTLPR
jgi:hypothetical protein